MLPLRAARGPGKGSGRKRKVKEGRISPAEGPFPRASFASACKIVQLYTTYLMKAGFLRMEATVVGNRVMLSMRAFSVLPPGHISVTLESKVD